MMGQTTLTRSLSSRPALTSSSLRPGGYGHLRLRRTFAAGRAYTVTFSFADELGVDREGCDGDR